MTFRSLATGLVFLTALLTLGACEKDPNDASTWIPKLKDANEFKEAVRNLERESEPRALT